MATLDPSDCSGARQKAVADAKKMQAAVTNECTEAGLDPPPYVLIELIGKGSFGRVYKAIGTGRPEFVAVKIISIDEGDSLAPGAADTLKDILKEVETLKLLSSNGAKNVNTVLDTLLVGHAMWMVTEYCAGGSVATLMRPTGFLAEKWIIPILREVAVGIYWVHKQGVIHRDIKCANVLVTKDGGIQLCDFGVAALVETKTDKRKTVTGTLNWMAPEFFDSNVSYGASVDIWAFGSMAFEAATGAPPNASSITDISQFGQHLKHHCPRLEGDQYTAELKHIIATCMVKSPKHRPTIQQLQNHPYISNTEQDYPTESLSNLVQAYKIWEVQGGSRRSLFSAGGAQCQLSNESSFSNNWTFDDDSEPDRLVFDTDAQKVHEVYGSKVDFPPHQAARKGRRRLASDMRPLEAPLEKAFDPNTITDYKDHTRAFYSKQGSSSLPSSDSTNKLEKQSVRGFGGVGSIDPGSGYEASGQDQSIIPHIIDMYAAGSNADSSLIEADKYQDEPCRSKRPSTKDWTFATAVCKSPSQDATQAREIDLVAGFQPDRPQLQPSSTVLTPAFVDLNCRRLSDVSLIDLDASVPTAPTHASESSTASCDSTSTCSSKGNTFYLERYLQHPSSETPTYRPPSIFASNDVHPRGEQARHLSHPSSLDSFFETSPGSPSKTFVVDQEATQEMEASCALSVTTESETIKPDPDATLKPPLTRMEGHTESSVRLVCPTLPEPPSARVMEGDADRDDVKAELRRLAASAADHFKFMADTLPTGFCGVGLDDGFPVLAAKESAAEEDR
jgi:serine/threonine protein kinase